MKFQDNIEYHGHAGVSRDCLDALARLLQHREHFDQCRLLTAAAASQSRHAFLLHVFEGGYVALKSGFRSGYPGEGPDALSVALTLLDAHGLDIEEVQVPPSTLDRLDVARLTPRDLAGVASASPVRPQRWHDYTQHRHSGSSHRPDAEAPSTRGICGGHPTSGAVISAPRSRRASSRRRCSTSPSTSGPTPTPAC